MIRDYRVVKMRNAEFEHWVVVSISLRGDGTWDVINEFDNKDDALAYVTRVRARQGATP